MDPSDTGGMKYMGKNLAGTEITIVGLKAKPELNGTKGVMLNWHAESERWMIRSHKTGDSLRLRFENVRFPTAEEYEAEEATKRATEEQEKARAAAAVAPSMRGAPSDLRPPP
eukprot:CAMPEP_0174730162 /NCGR_PEP_ID=MMETSP1094-20130205/55038_1 /TAXON_ID=156173 /ORGANISM="Chrysochromulina brevifilum, Strain UTEX LB 985" /LENGTH=112 /DNA_ID=CAMNT_0015932377 /DNA_START=72 /DNA_END=407 /DNA_ORIENTATION=-